MWQHWPKHASFRRTSPGGGGTDLEREYGDVRPWRPPFHASPAAHKGPISSKRVSSQDPLLRKFGNFSLNSLDFHPNFSSQAPKFGNFQLTSPKFGNFQLTSPQIWKFSAHKPPFSEANVSSQAPHHTQGRRSVLNMGGGMIGWRVSANCAHRGVSEGGCAVLQYAWLVSKVISEFDLLTHREIALLVCHVT